MKFEDLMNQISDEAYLRAYYIDYKTLVFSKDNQHLYSEEMLLDTINRFKRYDLKRISEIESRSVFERMFI